MMRSYFLALGTVVVVCVGCHQGGGNPPINSQMYNAPPAERLMRPGPMVAGPGPGVLGMMGGGASRAFANQTSQLIFLGPGGMGIGWQINGGFAADQLSAPGRYNFNQGATYRLKLTNLGGDRPGLVLYPSLQVYPSHPNTDAYLSHNPVPIQLTDEDIDQVTSNNFVTKVIYLPDARHQELAIAGVETLVSTRLDPGVDPVSEASHRGTILAVIRVGNMDLETADPMPMAVNGIVRPISHVRQVSGKDDQFVAPMPVGFIDSKGKPTAMMMGAPRAIGGVPAYNPISGVGGTPVWGQPITGTPIGLPGHAQLPYGGPAGLRSHTVRNLTKTHIPGPTKDFLIDVKHKPGINMPDPVNYIQYEERQQGHQTPQRQHRDGQIRHRTILDGNQQ